jgi:hypothetical protein
MIGGLGALWGLTGVSLILGYAIVRLVPIVNEALSYHLRWYHWLALGLSVGSLAYAEGYRGFQKGFSPRVAARAKHMLEYPNLLHSLLGPLFCSGFFHTSKRRQISVIAVTIGIYTLVVLVGRLSQPWRGIVDAGVVVGLSWGVVSVIAFGIQAFVSKDFKHSPEVPEPITVSPARSTP